MNKLLLSMGTLIATLTVPSVVGDNYQLTSPQHKSLLVAVGCFWCGEQAFEQYAPGVVEAVSGYAGADGIPNPTYRNHPGHYEVVLVEYDPDQTSYSVLIDYAWKNLDPFNNFGQFCDSGFSYRPAIFYDNGEEQEVAERYVRETLLPAYPEWQAEDLVVSLLPRPTFWTAEGYHQDYYIKNPGDYGYYKNACGRSKRLKEVWGEDVYDCYHDFKSPCATKVINTNGTLVDAERNRKGAKEPEAALLPKKVWGIIGACVGFLAILLLVFCVICKRGKHKKTVL